MTKKPRAEKVANLPIVQHDPTLAEKRAVASYQRRKGELPPTPPMTCTKSEPDESGTRTAQINVDHPDRTAGYQMISDAIGTGDMTFTHGVLLDASGIAIKTDGSPDMERVNYALSIVKGIKPRNQVEAMLGMQMAAIHMATMRAAANLSAAKTGKSFELYERSLNKLGRTFTTQMEALKRYRSKGNQRIVVERVNVSEGGQAIVGNVEGGGRMKKEQVNPLKLDGRSTALHSQVEALRGEVPGTCYPRPARVSYARSESRGSQRPRQRPLSTRTVHLRGRKTEASCCVAH